MKRFVIKKAMKLRERFPSGDDFYTNLIFRHSSFAEATEQERKRIMLNSSALRYEEEFKHPFDSYFKLDLAPLLTGQVALDLGCFTGGRSVAWFERYRLDKIYGIDVEDTYIEAARHFAEVKGANAQFTNSDGESLPFEDETFDAILSFDVLEHVRDVKAVLLQCNRVLKKRGKLFVVFPSYFHPTGHHLSSVTITPGIHYFFSGKNLIDAYNEIVDERGI
ncbi:class I SAM-dependent methyltransferase, partial [Chloroflexota bacterium]